MTKISQTKSGLAIHCHHEILVEYCYDYQERVDYIKNNKPENEIKTRLMLFKILPKEAERDIPKECARAYKAYNEACKAYGEAYKAYNEACKARSEADKAWSEAYKARSEAYKAWSEADKNVFHKKWCGCKEWDGKKLVF